MLSYKIDLHSPIPNYSRLIDLPRLTSGAIVSGFGETIEVEQTVRAFRSREGIMNKTLRGLLIVAFSLIASTWLVSAADTRSSLPSILETGFSLFTKGGADPALDAWRKGGLAENDSRANAQVAFFRQLDSAIGNYRSHEVIDTKRIGSSSQIFYVGINFERGTVFGRFLLYRTEKDWVVQSMDFSTRPEAIMPGLALEAGTGL